jgi:signal transduction histidine kinase
MNKTDATLTPAARYSWLAMLCVLTALAWHGILDQYSSQDISASVASAGVIYGTARGINALVSVLQGTELNIVLVPLSIGEVLDPVNDLIERFSEVILVALASLALQKIVLAVVSHTLFNIVLLIAAVATGISLFMQYPRLHSTMLRVFLIVAFFRFSLGLVVLANSWVDATFLNEADQARHLAMERFQGELRQIDTLSRKEDEATVLLSSSRLLLGELKVQQTDIKRVLSEREEQLKLAVQKVEHLRNKADRLCQISELSPTCPAAVESAIAERDTTAVQREDAAASLAAIERDIEEQKLQMACLAKRQHGENCSFWDSLPDAPSPAMLRQKLNNINNSLSDFAENCINLLVSLLLKTVAIPVVFLYLLLKIARMNWSKL